MNAIQLHEKIKLLHDELDQVELPGSDRQEILKKVANEIQDMLALQEEGIEHHRGLGETLKEAVAQIEASHPEATLRMRQVIDQLAYMGI